MSERLRSRAGRGRANEPAPSITLDIGSIVIETEAERESVEAAAPALQQAFLLLGERLGKTPFRQFGEIGQRAKTLAVDPIRIPDFPLDELLSPRGVERLADDLYRELLRSRR